MGANTADLISSCSTKMSQALPGLAFTNASPGMLLRQVYTHLLRLKTNECIVPICREVRLVSLGNFIIRRETEGLAGETSKRLNLLPQLFIPK
jgi:hypothetical protein